MKKSSVIRWAGLGLMACALLVRADHHEEGFKSLFNGKDLTGWEGNEKLWSVKDGTITAVTTSADQLKFNTFLVWKGGEVKDFELRLSYKIIAGNSGIQYRSKLMDPQKFIVGGYQADFEAGKTYSGILYEEQGRGILAERGKVNRITADPKDKNKAKIENLATVGKTEDIQANLKHEDWNDYIIIAKGNRLTHIINGRVTADVIDDHAEKRSASGILALQVHTGPPMSVHFKNIRIKELH